MDESDGMDGMLSIGFLVGLLVAIPVIALLGADASICVSMLIIIIALLFLFFQTGPAAAPTSARCGRPTALISSTVVNLDSKTRWRGKSFEEEELGLILLLIGIVDIAISFAASLL